MGAAVGLLIVTNAIFSRLSWRVDLETLGRYGLSPSAKRILDETDAKIMLTSIYTSAKADRKAEDYLPRVRDLLAEIGRYDADVTAVNVTSDRQKAEVLARLRDRLDAKAKDHREVIKDFQMLVNTQSPQYDRMANRWQRYPTEGWLTQFGVGKAFEDAFKGNKEELNETATELRAKLTGSTLADYPRIVEQTKITLERLRSRLEQVGEHLRQLKGLPDNATKASASLNKAVSELASATGKIVDLAGKPGSAAPDDPSAVLDNLAKQAIIAANAADKVRAELTAFNAANGKYVQFATSWRVDGVPLTQRAARLTATCQSLAEQAQGVRAAAKLEVQKNFVKQMRPALPQLPTEAGKMAAGVGRLLGELTKLDKETQAIFTSAGKAGYLEAQIRPATDLIDRIDKLAELTDQKELIEQINQDNIVLVEIGEKVGVVGFDDVWPAAERQPWETPGMEDDDQSRRAFNGDAAICSKILSMALEPLGEVVLTFFEDMPPPYMRQYRRGVSGPIPLMLLTTLRERLEKANLKVTEWNLAKEDAPPEPAKGDVSQVLLVLPPPAPSPMPPRRGSPPPPKWGREHEEKFREVVDAGTAAVFLAAFIEPQHFGQFAPPPYVLGDYLKESWGVDVRTGLRVVQAEADPLNPGTYVLPVLRWTFMPLSTFTDHPVGKPLRTRRLYWLNACPVVRAEGSEAKTEIEDILAIPEGMTGTWAASNAVQLTAKLYTGKGRGIVPGSAEGDLTAPFPIAVQATKTVGEKTNSIIVLGVGLTYIDQFLNARIPRLTGGETLVTDPPPTGAVDLVINSVYHLIGKDGFIGAGPTPTPRIRHIPVGTMTALKVVFGLLWPLVLLGIGGVVMAARRR